MTIFKSYTLYVFLSILFTLIKANSSPLILVSYFDGDEIDSTNCKVNQLIKATIIKPLECIRFQHQHEFSTLKYNENDHDDIIVETLYNDLDCKEYKEQVFHRLNYCNSSAHSFWGVENIQLSIINDIDIPINTIVHVSYKGECNGQFKNTFKRIDYQYTNYCSGSEYITTKSSCNSTAEIVHTYKGPSCSGTQYLDQVFPFVNDCTDINNNYLQFCNI
ncbi:hypothetical protein DICPUDRAFT_153346 [Dictyostelium purpureum]|uniref:SUEL-type lectin domain-containing protein n=1 Tax=Dictyostelium purpureum TaxID=5786 RepID=F0ZNN5_DICPU|nr:uncharacterized protein DICPUDRAFT_153346 [Dictyostelium purpureum]EGC34451.1 hypothetical protein DICPUDRAFT_153346 [Dictyostelium purpureum]|eukprot:XP_003289036.1 hypothetical protein DICPUDRAFT_153346 [Dictyostelium purpureum]